MNKNEKSALMGYVEQAIPASQDPLAPPISISRNGSLAKWRGKFDFLDLRVNDPGLKKYPEAFRQMLQKATTLGIEVVVTLPQYVPVIFELPPEEEQKVTATPRRSSQKKPDRLVYFKPAYLALSGSVEGSVSMQKIDAQDCLPIMEMAAEAGVKHVVVPVSEPGQYLDRMAEKEFKKQFEKIAAFAAEKQLKIHVKNGGLSATMFAALKKSYGCGLAYNVGIGHLERDEILDQYNRYKNDITILMLHQVLPGVDRWANRITGIEKCLKAYVNAKKDYRQSLDENEEAYTANCLKRYNSALRDYYEAMKNPDVNLGLFQNGDINLVPLLKELKKDLEDGAEKYLLLETVPNTKNNDFVLRYLMSDSFSGSF